VIGGQRILILGICVYLCALPVLVAANVCLDGTSDKPTFAPAFGVVMAVGLPGILSAVVYASFGAFHRDRVLSHGSTRYVDAVGVLVPAPLIGVVVMVVANSKVTGYLKACEVEVGFLSARD